MNGMDNPECFNCHSDDASAYLADKPSGATVIVHWCDECAGEVEEV